MVPPRKYRYLADTSKKFPASTKGFDIFHEFEEKHYDFLPLSTITEEEPFT